ncbi:MAG: hypothetical protein M5U34_07740 [Chloroflexi bacterium]|nr:hypothetical protein [Chloroflexota bacterium]
MFQHVHPPAACQEATFQQNGRFPLSSQPPNRTPRSLPQNPAASSANQLQINCKLLGKTAVSPPKFTLPTQDSQPIFTPSPTKTCYHTCLT